MRSKQKFYKFKEIFYTLQGEGFHSGRPAIFCRFTGCNLWSGREEDREHAVCTFCDTSFVGMNGENGGSYSPEELVGKIYELWPRHVDQRMKPFIVCTGGEPLLQLDHTLVDALKSYAIEVAIETNGTIIPPKGIDWVCMSPKAGSKIIVKSGNEIKLVYPQQHMSPQLFQNWDFEHFYLQPMYGEYTSQNTTMAIQYCKENPKWKLSIQSHKVLQIP